VPDADSLQSAGEPACNGPKIVLPEARVPVSFPFGAEPLGESGLPIV
jgi:hypothetical protein